MANTRKDNGGPGGRLTKLNELGRRWGRKREAPVEITNTQWLAFHQQPWVKIGVWSNRQHKKIQKFRAALGV